MDRIATGRIRTSHGVKGYLKVEVYSYDLEHFLTHESVILRKEKTERPMDIEDAMIQGNSVLVKFAGIDTPEAARKYNGWEILVDKDRSTPLAADEFYYADLQHCDLLLGDRKVGEVVSVIEGPQSELMEVKKEDGSLCYIPFLNEYIGEVDVEKKTIELLHEWILG